MPKRDPRIDGKIASAPAFARPILEHIRALAHKGCPEAEEAVKWGMPFFTYGGSPLMHMAAFKAHVVLGFWLGPLIVGEKSLETAMGQFGRITSLKELPEDKVILACIKKAMALTDQGAKNPTRGAGAKPKPPPKAPAFLMAAFRGDAKAAAGFKTLTPGKQREYVAWLVDAKTEATREKRLAQALEWMAEGKGLNWRYEKK